MEHVIVEAFCSCAIDYYVRHCQHLEEIRAGVKMLQKNTGVSQRTQFSCRLRPINEERRDISRASTISIKGILIQLTSRQRNYLQQQPHPLVLFGCRSQKTFSIQCNQAKVGVVGCPYAHSTGTRGLGSVENGLTIEEDVVESVGLAITSVAKDGENLDTCHVPAAKSFYKLRLTTDLMQK